MRAATKKNSAMSQMLSLMISGSNTIIGKLKTNDYESNRHIIEDPRIQNL